MGKLKRTVSAVMAMMIALNIFAGLAAATTITEPPDVSNTKSGAYTIYCPNYAASDAYQADIYTGSDADWFKCSVNSGDKVAQFVEVGAYNSYVAMYAEDSSNPVKFVERMSLRYGNNGTGIVSTSPVYFKVVNDYQNIYYGYQHFIGRNWP